MTASNPHTEDGDHDPRRHYQESAQDLIAAVYHLSASSPVWMSGVVLGLAMLGWNTLRLEDEARDWVTYALLGAAVPVCGVVVSRMAGRSVVTLLIFLLGLTGALAAFGLSLGRVTVAATVASALTALAIHVLGSRTLGFGSSVATAAQTIFGIVAWCALAEVSSRRLFPTSEPYGLFVAACAIVVSTAGLVCFPPRRRFAIATSAVAIFSFALSSVRASPFYDLAVHHWGAIVGPAALVRQGSWLLWDVPSQYGFLSTLTIVATPGETVWQSFYLLNGILHFLAACLLFLMLGGVHGGPIRAFFAFLVTEAAVFLVPGFPDQLTGPWIVPNASAFRFIWCYVLLALLFRVHQLERGGKPLHRVLVLGCMAWLLATLWSAESAFYAAVVWLPAFAGTVVANNRESPAHAARWLGVPPILLLASVAILEAFYLAQLGHGPDWYAFFDYVLAFGAGFNSLPINPTGAVWLLVIALWAIASTGALLLARDAPPSALALAWGAWAVIWATGSYFVHRSDDTNATNLSPLICAGLAAGTHLLREHGRGGVASSINAALIPLFSVLLTLGFGNLAPLRRLAGELGKGYVHNIDRLLRDADPSLQMLVSRAGLSIDDRITYLDTTPNGNPVPPLRLASPDGLRRVTMAAAWLPSPLTLLVPLPANRATTYVSRFAAQRPGGGWLIQPKAGTDISRLEWLPKWLGDTHVPKGSLDNSEWRLTRIDDAPPGGLFKGLVGEPGASESTIWGR